MGWDTVHPVGKTALEVSTNPPSISETPGKDNLPPQSTDWQLGRWLSLLKDMNHSPEEQRNLLNIWWCLKFQRSRIRWGWRVSQEAIWWKLYGAILTEIELWSTVARPHPAHAGYSKQGVHWTSRSSTKMPPARAWSDLSQESRISYATTNSLHCILYAITNWTGCCTKIQHVFNKYKTR